jgi:hypothetical protein
MGGRRRGTREDQHAMGRGAGPRAPGCRSRPSSCPRPGPAPRCGRRSAGSDGRGRMGRGKGSVSLGAVGIDVVQTRSKNGRRRRQRERARGVMAGGRRDDRTRSRAQRERRDRGRRPASYPRARGWGVFCRHHPTQQFTMQPSLGGGSGRASDAAEAGPTPKSAGRTTPVWSSVGRVGGFHGFPGERRPSPNPSHPPRKSDSSAPRAPREQKRSVRRKPSEVVPANARESLRLRPQCTRVGPYSGVLRGVF